MKKPAIGAWLTQFISAWNCALLVQHDQDPSLFEKLPGQKGSQLCTQLPKKRAKIAMKHM